MFYVAHRLFAAHDRHLGALAAAQLAAVIGADRVFLPFCDTNEEELEAPVKGRRLFELDCQRLPTLHGMLAIMHGPSLDDGVCMEIGYAAARGIPVVVFTTDFQTYGLSADGVELAFADPLVQIVATDVVRVDRLDANPSSSDHYANFAARNRGQLHCGIRAAVHRLLEVERVPGPPSSPDVQSDSMFVEPSPYGPDQGWLRLTEELPNGVASVRWRTRFDSGDPVGAAVEDWAAAGRCQTLLVDVRGPEAPPGAALLIGASVANAKRVLAYCPRPTWTFASGREPNWRNLMIQYSVTERVSAITGVLDGSRR